MYLLRLALTTAQMETVRSRTQALCLNNGVGLCMYKTSTVSQASRSQVKRNHTRRTHRSRSESWRKSPNHPLWW